MGICVIGPGIDDRQHGDLVDMLEIRHGAGVPVQGDRGRGLGSQAGHADHADDGLAVQPEHHVEVQGGRFTVVVYHGDHRNIVVQVGLVLGDAVDQEAHIHGDEVGIIGHGYRHVRFVVGKVSLIACVRHAHLDGDRAATGQERGPGNRGLPLLTGRDVGDRIVADEPFDAVEEADGDVARGPVAQVGNLGGHYDLATPRRFRTDVHVIGDH
ncbi:hypothetical protein DSECCO2_585890 [anaerobic digester metagenome]